MRYLFLMHSELAGAVEAQLQLFERDRVIARIWERDHTVWKPDPTELADRLGWLDVAKGMRSAVPELEAFAADVAGAGFRHVLLLGMGGSSLGPEVIRATYGIAPGRLDLVILDSTDPVQIRETEAKLHLARTLVIVASKSGTTIETTSHLDYFWRRIGKGEQFVAITDHGTPLEALGIARNFRRVFTNRPDIGGRYSVLSHFGMVPAALIGAPIGQMLDDAMAMAANCGPDVPLRENPGAMLGVQLGEAALAGGDKCTLIFREEFSLLGTWVEQLVAESTGKEGRGILPLEREPLGGPEVYGHDRIFVAYEDGPALAAIEAAGHPAIRMESAGLGGELFRWEFATAVAGAVLAVQPFDQPNVQEAKDAAARVLSGNVPEVAPMTLTEVLGSIEPGDYIAVNAFISRNKEHAERLQTIRVTLRDRYHVACSVGFGPRFLHSTGQLHKGGPPIGAFIEVVNEDAGDDLQIPGRSYTFRQLLDAQALGDLAALLGRGRRACRVTLTGLETALRS